MTPLDYLYSLELHGIKLGLENINRLLSEGGEPHRAYPTVHVAGTNGKGSVVAMLYAMLRAGRFSEATILGAADVAPQHDGVCIVIAGPASIARSRGDARGYLQKE